MLLFNKDLCMYTYGPIGCHTNKLVIVIVQALTLRSVGLAILQVC